MKVGQTFTIEPMICVGREKAMHWPDNVSPARASLLCRVTDPHLSSLRPQWTATTEDGKASAQFEETLLVTATGVEVLTAAPGWKLPEKDA